MPYPERFGDPQDYSDWEKLTQGRFSLALQCLLTLKLHSCPRVTVTVQINSLTPVFSSHAPSDLRCFTSRCSAHTCSHHFLTSQPLWSRLFGQPYHSTCRHFHSSCPLGSLLTVSHEPYCEDL